MWADIALLLLSMIFSLTNAFRVSAVFGIGEEMTLLDEGIKPVVMVFYLLAMISIVAPLLFKKKHKPIHFLTAKIMTILMLVWFLFVLLVGVSEVSSSDYSSLAEFKVSGSGCFFLLTTMGALMLAFKITGDLKKEKMVQNHTQEVEVKES